MSASLPALLKLIEENDSKYDVREKLVYQALALAKSLGYEAGIRFDPAEPNWPVVCIMLPGFGEVYWHCPAFPRAYDVYSSKDKYERINKFVMNQSAKEKEPPCLKKKQINEQVASSSCDDFSDYLCISSLDSDSKRTCSMA